MNSMVRSRAGRKTCTCATEVLTMPSPIRTNLFRLAELQKLAILDPAPERIYDDLVRSLFQNLEAPIAMMNLLDSHRDWFKSCVGLPLTESPASTSFLRCVPRQSWRPGRGGRHAKRCKVCRSPTGRWCAVRPLLCRCKAGSGRSDDRHALHLRFETAPNFRRAARRSSINGERCH